MVLLELLLVLFLCQMGMVGMEVFCSSSTEPVALGETFNLFCNSSGISCSQCNHIWQKGDLLLSFDNFTVDADKYAVKQQKDGFIFQIKNTTFDDFNVEYKCSYLFSSCTTNLTLPASFEYPPRQDTIENKVSVVQRTLLFDVIFKAVHPVPVCNIYLDGDNLSLYVTEEVEKKGNLYKVMKHLNHTVKPDQCEGRLYLDCKTGIRNDIIFNDSVSFECTGDTEKTGNVTELAASIVAVTFIVLSAVVCCCLMKRMKRMKRMRRSLTEETHYKKPNATCKTKNEKTFTWEKKREEIKTVNDSKKLVVVEMIPMTSPSKNSTEPKSSNNSL